MSLTRYFPVMFEQNKQCRAASEAYFGEIDRVVPADRLALLSDLLKSTPLRQIGYRSAVYNTVAEQRDMKNHDAMVLNDPGIQQFWHMHRWAHTGRVTYDVDVDLCRAFLDTDLRATGEDVLLPVPTFYLAVPKELGLTVNNATGEHVIDGFFVSDTSTIGGRGRSALGDEEDYVNSAYYAEEGYDRQFMLLAVGLSHEGEPIYNTALVSFCVPMGMTYDYEKWVTLLSSDLKWQRGMHHNLDRIRVWVRLILNTLLYLNSEAPDVEHQRLGPSAELRRKAREGKKADRRALDAATLPVRYLRVGHRIPKDAQTPLNETERALSVRFMVRGHWRRQVHGEGRKERKLIWIRPFYKGPEWAEMIRARVQKIVP